MSFYRTFQWYHCHADPIWLDGTFKYRRNATVSVAGSLNIFPDTEILDG